MKVIDIINELSFHGRPCTKDCSGHKAGWEWERKNQTNQPTSSASPSFNNGVDIAISQAKNGKKPISTNIRGAKGRFQKFQPQMEDVEVDEIIGVKKYHDMTAEEATEAIAKDMGTKVLGNGAFGRVIQSSNPEVVYKIFEKDDAYLRFVRFVERYPSKNFPKIHKVKNMTSFFKRYGVQADKFYVIATEKLYKIDGKPFDAVFLSNFLAAPSLDHPTRYMPNGRENAFMVPVREFMQYLPELKELWQAGLKIRGLHRESPDFNWDLHSGNIMKRADGTIVITDPLSSSDAFDYKDDVYRAQANDEPMIKGPHYRKKEVPSTSRQPTTHNDDVKNLIRQAKAKVAELKDKIDNGEELSGTEKNMYNALKLFIARQEPQVGRVSSPAPKAPQVPKTIIAAKDLYDMNRSIKDRIARIIGKNEESKTKTNELQVLKQLQAEHDNLEKKYGIVFRAYEQYTKLKRIPEPSSYQAARIRQLEAFIDQKMKIAK